MSGKQDGTVEMTPAIGDPLLTFAQRCYTLVISGADESLIRQQ